MQKKKSFKNGTLFVFTFFDFRKIDQNYFLKILRNSETILSVLIVRTLEKKEGNNPLFKSQDARVKKRVSKSFAERQACNPFQDSVQDSSRLFFLWGWENANLAPTLKNSFELI